MSQLAEDNRSLILKIYLSLLLGIVPTLTDDETTQKGKDLWRGRQKLDKRNHGEPWPKIYTIVRVAVVTNLSKKYVLVTTTGTKIAILGYVLNVNTATKAGS